MGQLEKEARDARVAEQQKRMTIFGGFELQQKMVNEVKAPLMEAFGALMNPGSGGGKKLGALLKLRRAAAAFGEFPEPDKANTWHPNSQTLIEIRDKFFTHCKLDERRQKFLRMGINFLIVLYDYDPPYRMMIDWWAKALKAGNWNYDVPVTVVGHNWPWWVE